MARKIIGKVGSLLGLKKKKKPDETTAAPAAQKGPIIKQLGGTNTPTVTNLAAIRARLGNGGPGTLLSDKLGG
jgi:hypothetical protein